MYYIYQQKDTVQLFFSVHTILNQGILTLVIRSDCFYECCLINELFATLWQTLPGDD